MHEVSNPWPNFPDEPAYVLDIDQPSVDDWNQYVRRQPRFNTDAVHEVELGAFYMGTHQVTVGQFKKFVAASGYGCSDWENVAEYSPTDEHPMIDVNWHDVSAYAMWASKRLPTEAEWEYAARGGLVGKCYLWGDEASTSDMANYGGTVRTTTVAGSYPANGHSLYDMAGNVWEWCADWYGHDSYSKSPDKNPTGPAEAQSGCYAGAIGITMALTCVWRTATATLPIMGTATTDLDVCQICSRGYNTPIHSADSTGHVAKGGLKKSVKLNSFACLW